MKVKDLIKQLSEFPENTEIKFYNGFVDDFQEIDIQENLLIKEKPKAWLPIVNAQNRELGRPEVTKLNRKTEWELWNEFVSPEHLKEFYSQKKVLLLSGKLRGKVCHDRIGSIEY